MVFLGSTCSNAQSRTGGSMQNQNGGNGIVSHAAGVVVIDVAEVSLRIALLEYSGRETSWRLPMETRRKPEGPVKTFRRCIADEVAASGAMFRFRVIGRAARLYHVKVPDQERGNEWHLKCFGAITDTVGAFRTEPLQDGGQVIGPPVFFEAREAVLRIQSTITEGLRAHLHAVYATLVYFSGTRAGRRFRRSYQSDLDAWNAALPRPSGADEATIDEYFATFRRPPH